jgi:hypothetical protein
MEVVMLSRSSRVTLAVMCLSSALAPGAARAQVGAGAEFQVNTYTTNSQEPVSIAPLPDGGFVVVMNELRAGTTEVFAQRLNAAGAKGGPETRVNSYTTGSQSSGVSGAVAADGRGRFVVVWTSNGQDGDQGGVFGQRFDGAGVRLGAEFRVNASTTGHQFGPGVASATDGRFVVAWAAAEPTGPGVDVFARPFDRDGNAVGVEFRVNSYTTGVQTLPDVAADAAGRFVVVWLDGDGSLFGVRARAHDASGTPLGSEFTVNTYTTGNQRNYGTAMAPDGRFVVVWRGPDGDAYGVFAQRFDAAASPVGAEFRVNAATTGDQSVGVPAMDRAGNFVVSWHELTPGDGGGGSYGPAAVFGQRFDSEGQRRGSEFRINSYTTGDQTNAQPAVDAVGNFIVTWRSGLFSGSQDGSGAGAFAQRYGGLRPASLAVVDGGNGVLEVPDDFALTTAWRNFSGAPQVIQGQASNAVVPPGLFLTLSPSADYGTIPDGADGPCSGQCFGGALLGTRPPGHVDLTFRETLSPDAQGQVHTWRLHVGRSFTDVNTAGAFYRFVETLFHHGVTGGCTASTYCPTAITTRREMAVFMLLAKEGAGYAPPACTAVPFPDVPVASGFCPFIAELSRRGVVAGCGGGNYCPANPVLRQEMAVFALATLDPTFTPPPCTVPPFADVPTGNPFCPHIAELAARGVVSGCGGGNYCPAAAVTRQEMAVFIAGTFGLLLYGV